MKGEEDLPVVVAPAIVVAPEESHAPAPSRPAPAAPRRARTADASLAMDHGRLRVELERLRTQPPMRPASFYMILIFGLMFTAITAVLLVLVLRPGEDNTVIIVAILGFLGPLLAAIVGMMVKDVHTVINSRMDALLAATERAASLEGHAAGKAERRT